MKNSYAKSAAFVVLSSALTLASYPALAGSHMASKEKSMSESEQGYFASGWREGKIETAIIFNEHLSVFDIDVEVNDNVAYLVGTVSSEIDKDLAEEVALSVEGITEVKNDLKVNKDVDRNRDRSDRDDTDSQFLQAVNDATITARVKTALLTNDNVAGLDIDVDTDNQTVTLKGKVKSEREKDLAEKITANVDGVGSVDNQLKTK